MTAGAGPASLRSTLRPPPAEPARRLREFFAASGYAEESIKKAIGVAIPTAGQHHNLPRLLERTREPTAFNQLVRWFLLGQPSPSAELPVPEAITGAALEAGLLERSGPALSPAVLVAPHAGLLVAHDRFDGDHSPLAADHVLGMSPSSQHLLRALIRTPSPSTLDLGCGNGVAALVSARRGGSVVATDLNPRAVLFTEFNARLNGIDNVECLTGDRFAPVGDRMFDRIVCNPPFAVTPSREVLYRENELPLDQFCRELVREGARHLNENGILQMMSEWVEIEGEPWPRRLAGWLEGTGCDGWVLAHFTQDPASYAAVRLRELSHGGEAQDAAVFAEWMRYYRENRVVSIHGGLLTVRRRAGANWIRIEQLRAILEEPFGDALAQGLEARDFLEAHGSDEDLLAIRPRLSPAARLDQQSVARAGAWEPRTLKMSLEGGLKQQIDLDAGGAALLARFDGIVTTAQLIEQATADTGSDPKTVREVCLTMVRRMIERGFLLP